MSRYELGKRACRLDNYYFDVLAKKEEVNKLKEEFEQTQNALPDINDMRRRLKALEKKNSELENSLALGCCKCSELTR